MSDYEEWYINDVDSDDGIFGPGYCACGKEGLHVECQEKQRVIRNEIKFIDELYEGFNLHAADTTKASLYEAEEALLNTLDFDPRENGYVIEDVQENKEIYYFPIGWIGCSGYIVVKADLSIIQFGSYIGHKENIWAFYQGICFGRTKYDRSNSFVINAVKNKEKMIKVLKRFLGSEYIKNEIEPNLSKLPIKIYDVDLYFSIRELLQTQFHGWFEYSIE